MPSPPRSPRRCVPSVTLLLGGAALALATSACGTTLDPAANGSGTVVESEREVTSFGAIEVDGPLAVSVAVGTPAAVVVRTDDNLQERVTAEVEDDTLRLGLAENARTDTLEVLVTVPSDTLRSLDVDGAASLTDTDPLDGSSVQLRADGASRVFVVVAVDDLVIEAEGASVVNVTGEAGELGVSASGASSVEVGELVAQNASVEVDGASRATLSVTGSLDARATGASTVEYSGDPQVTADADESSTIRAR
jgi:hypothetical protein